MTEGLQPHIAENSTIPPTDLINAYDDLDVKLGRGLGGEVVKRELSDRHQLSPAPFSKCLGHA